MSEYPRDLLISESVIRDFEERVGVRFINKTECAKALEEHDAKVRADAINECYELDILKYKICCPLCDSEKCVKGSDKCDAEIWKREQLKENL